MSSFSNSTHDVYDATPPPPRPAPTIHEELVGPTVTYAILAVTVLVYVLQFLSENLMGTDIPAALGLKDNAAIIAGQYWRLFTPMLLHGSILHIGFNMYALVIIGVGMERRFGHGRYLLLYILTGFSGNVVSFLFSPYPSLGASTAIFGLLGAEMVFIYRNRQLFGKQANRVLWNVIFIAGVNLLIGLAPGIDNWGHVGGLLGGLIFGWFGGPLLVLHGSYPTFEIEDETGSGGILLASVLVASIFTMLTVGHIGGLF